MVLMSLTRISRSKLNLILRTAKDLRCYVGTRNLCLGTCDRIYLIASRGLQSFFHHFMRLMNMAGLQSKTAYIFLFLYLSKGIDDAQSFLDYILSTKLSSHSVTFSIVRTSVTGRIIMNI